MTGVDRRKRSMLTLRTLRPVRRATPARAVAAVMAAHANQHGAETPSRPSLDSPVHVYTVHRFRRHGMPRCAAYIGVRQSRARAYTHHPAGRRTCRT